MNTYAAQPITVNPLSTEKRPSTIGIVSAMGIALFISLQGLDLITTLILLAAGGQEMNGLAAWLVSVTGPLGLVALKVICTTLFVWVLWLGVKRNPVMWVFLWIGVLYFIGIAANNLFGMYLLFGPLS